MLFRSDNYGNEERVEVQDTVELTLMKKRAFDSAMSILFPENYDMNIHEDIVGPKGGTPGAEK